MYKLIFFNVQSSMNSHCYCCVKLGKITTESCIETFCANRSEQFEVRNLFRSQGSNAGCVHSRWTCCQNESLHNPDFCVVSPVFPPHIILLPVSSPSFSPHSFRSCLIHPFFSLSVTSGPGSFSC